MRKINKNDLKKVRGGTMPDGIPVSVSITSSSLRNVMAVTTPAGLKRIEFPNSSPIQALTDAFRG